MVDTESMIKSFRLAWLKRIFGDNSSSRTSFKRDRWSYLVHNHRRTGTFGLGGVGPSCPKKIRNARMHEC